MKMLKTKLAKNPEAGALVRRLRTEGKSYRDIESILKSRGYEVSHQAVKNFMDKTDVLGTQIIQQDEQLRYLIKKDILDTTTQMKKINEKLWELVESLEQTQDEVDKARTQTTILDKLMRQLELQARLMGKLHQAATATRSVTQNISYLDFSTKVTNQLIKLEKAGFIKILKPLDEMEEF